VELGEIEQLDVELAVLDSALVGVSQTARKTP
jgi:hypothetical protein